MDFGEIIYHGAPQNAIDELKGKVYQKIVERNQFEKYAKDYNIISNKMIGGRPLIRIFNEEHPYNGFDHVTPNLEDVFFSRIRISNILV